MARTVAPASLAAVVALACAAPARAQPMADDLDAHAAVVRDRLDGRGFTVLVEPPFVVIGDEAPAKVRRRAETTLRWAVSRLEKQFFPRRPDRVIEIWLFRNETTYRRGARELFGDDPTTPYGYYSADDDAIIMNIGPGAGTLVHELVHPYMEANFPGVPSWMNEGLASLYERPVDRDGAIWGLPNWRLRNLKREIRAGRLPPLPDLLATSTAAFYDAEYDSYAFARYLLLYLQEQGTLVDFYRRFLAARRDDPTGVATLRAVLGETDLAAFQRRWARWVLRLEE